jgi:O-antigen ligase
MAGPVLPDAQPCQGDQAPHPLGTLLVLHRRVTLGIVAALFFGLQITHVISDTAAGLLILWAPLAWRQFSAGLRQWPGWLVVLPLTPLAAAVLASAQALPAGVEPWNAILAHRKELMFIVLLAVLGAAPAGRIAAGATAAGAVLAILLTLFFWLTDTSTRSEPFDPSHPVVMNHSVQNFVLGFVALAAIVLATRKWISPLERGGLLGAAVAALFTLGAVVTGRTGQLATIVMGSVLIFKWAPRRWRLAVLLLLAGSLASVIALSPETRQRYAVIASDMARYRAGDPESDTGYRLHYWLNSLRLIEQRPLLGHGTGSFRSAYDRLLGIDETSTRSTPHPHSDLLYYQVERGIPGSASLLAVFAALFVMSRRLTDPQRTLLQALLAGFVFASLVNAFYRDWSSGAFFLAMAALLIATGRKNG